MNIRRSIYFERIKPFINTQIVKVITGIRRCGKSVMMMQLCDYLIQNGVDEKQILFLNFESLTDERIKSFESVTHSVKETSNSCLDKKIYL